MRRSEQGKRFVMARLWPEFAPIHCLVRRPILPCQRVSHLLSRVLLALRWSGIEFVASCKSFCERELQNCVVCR